MNALKFNKTTIAAPKKDNSLNTSAKSPGGLQVEPVINSVK